MTGNMAVVEELLENGTDPNQADKVRAVHVGKDGTSSHIYAIHLAELELVA